MHKSRLGTIVIDCATSDLERDGTFWSAVFGCDVEVSNLPGDENYLLLKTLPDQPKTLLQKVSHPSRVHLDIETDDVEAEVRRLEKLGATRVEKVRDWWVMEAPSGHRFCVVKPQRPDFDSGAKSWDDPDT